MKDQTAPTTLIGTAYSHVVVESRNFGESPRKDAYISVCSGEDACYICLDKQEVKQLIRALKDAID